MEQGREEGIQYLKNKNVMPDADWENCVACDAATGACSRATAAESPLEAPAD
jgi:hypothetical protein